jgi:hypothetical protein
MSRRVRGARRAAVLGIAVLGLSGIAALVLVAAARADASAAKASRAAADRPLILKSAGAPRALPPRILGASVAPFQEPLLDDPQKIRFIRDMSLGYVRFPGGTLANYYDWRTGLPRMRIYPNSSAYSRYWADLCSKIRQANPGGISIDRFRAFAEAIGAGVILVPNLETSTSLEQADWFRKMKADGALPDRIEWGSDFATAMGEDPNVLVRWGGARATWPITRQYCDDLKEFFAPGTKTAVQSAGSAFSVDPASAAKTPLAKHLLLWDANMNPGAWFDAVTVHLYPRALDVLGLAADKPLSEGLGGALRIFGAMMARCDDGVDRVLADLERRLVGKEIWITEWSPRGAEAMTAAEPVAPPMLMLLAARTLLSCLRHPAIAIAQFSPLDMSGAGPDSVVRPDGRGGFVPEGIAVALRWFNEAANARPGESPVIYESYVEDGGAASPGGGVWKETYRPLEAASFKRDGGETTIILNASAELRTFRIAAAGEGNAGSGGSAPSAAPLVQTAVFAALDDPAHVPPEIRTADPAADIPLPPYSLTRIVRKSQGGPDAHRTD